MHTLVVSVLLVFGFPVVMNKVVDSFGKCSQFFLEEQSPVIPGVLNNLVSLDNNRYKIICQKYKNVIRFATLYDKDKKIPVFSAYRYTGSYSGRPRIPWMIEPQLEVSSGVMRVPCVNQAHYLDYVNSMKLDRGHLFPNSHAVDEATAYSTFTLTNAVPQHHSFNNGSWIRMEQKVRDIMDLQCHDKDKPDQTLAYVLTGAVASPEELMNDKVNIPTHMWTVFCCYNHERGKWVSQAHWAENIDEPNDTNIDTISLGNLQEFLQEKYNSGSIILFNNICQDFFTKISLDKNTEDIK